MGRGRAGQGKAKKAGVMERGTAEEENGKRRRHGIRQDIKKKKMGKGRE